MTTCLKVRPGGGGLQPRNGWTLWQSVILVAVVFLTPPATAIAEWVSSYPAAQQIAAERNQPICLYFRKASAPACQNFERHVLTQPVVSSALAGFVLVYLDPAWNETLAEQYRDSCWNAVPFDRDRFGLGAHLHARLRCTR